MATALIDGTPFTISFILDKMTPTVPDICHLDLQGFEVENITASAFMSSIYRVKMLWKTDKGAPNSIIIKVPGPHRELFEDVIDLEKVEAESKDIGGETMDDFLEQAHTREIQFYSLLPRYEPSLKLPKFYYGFEYKKEQQSGLIIMEDMTTVATTANVLPGFTDKQVLAVVDEMAKVHATSWKYDEWRTQIVQKEIDPIFIREMINATCVLKIIKPEPFVEIVDKIVKIFTIEHFKGANYSEDKFGFPSCLVHADLWAPNILWVKDTEGRPTDELAAIIDWQTMHAGNPCSDISRILSLNTTGEYRRKNLDRILNFYSERIAAYMPDGKPPFTREQLDVAYKNTLPWNAAYFGFGIPVYHKMDSVVGTGEQRPINQTELLSRVQMFFEDVLDEFRDELI